MKRAVEARRPQQEARDANQDRVDHEHEVARREREVVVHDRVRQRHRPQVMQPSLRVDSVRADPRTRPVLNAEVEELARSGVDLRMCREGVRRLQLAVVVVLADRVERVRVEPPRSSSLPQGEEVAGVERDTRVGDVGGEPECISQHAAGLLRAEPAKERFVGCALSEVVGRAHESVAVVDATVANRELREHSVAVEEMGERLAPDLVLARTVPVKRAGECRGDLTFDLIDDIVVLVEERVEDPVPVGCYGGLEGLCL